MADLTGTEVSLKVIAEEGKGSQRAAELERLRRLFRFFSATQGSGRSLVYETLCDAVACGDDLLCLLLVAPGEQRRPSLLFAAVNLLLASHPLSELAAYYLIHGGRRPVDDRLVAAFAAFCHEHRDELVAVLGERSTQTNEIRRCIALHLGLDHVHRHWPGPLALVEVGASAGLNLLFDRFSYRLGGRITATRGPSPVVVSCDISGTSDTQILQAPPQITTRLGIDQHPIDLSDPDDRAWLEAFVWPEQIEELATLRAAIDLAASTEGVSVVAGDASTDTARILGKLPGTEPAVVFTASLLSYLTTQARAAFTAQLQQAARFRPVAWVFAEAPGLLATTDLNIAELSGPIARRNSLYAVGASLRGPGHRHDQLLALADPYLRWLAPARNGADDFAWVPAEPAGPSFTDLATSKRGTSRRRSLCADDDDV